MRILIVEDNAFNAFCLGRLLESVMSLSTVTVVKNSHEALSLIKNNPQDMVIIDGDLSALNDGVHCNGPELAHILLQQYPHLPVIAWSDSEGMRDEFAQVFKWHEQPINEFKMWTKVVSLDRISKTCAYYFGEFVGFSECVAPFPHAKVGYR
jgi:CheY-like chemotaxis protein